MYVPNAIKAEQSTTVHYSPDRNENPFLSPIRGKKDCSV
jgi:hypothetical protein